MLLKMGLSDYTVYSNYIKLNNYNE